MISLAASSAQRAGVEPRQSPQGSRRLPAPWRADKMPGGYVVRDALACPYSRDDPTEALQAKMMTPDEAPDRDQHRTAAGAAREGGSRLMPTLTDEQLRALRILPLHPDRCAEGKLDRWLLHRAAVPASHWRMRRLTRKRVDVGGRERMVLWVEITEEGRNAIA
jgi:hypothetical protein